MTVDPAGILRMCLAVDVADYSVRDDAGQLEIQQLLLTVLDQVGANATLLRRLDWRRQAQGDGELALLPPDLDQARAVPEFVRELLIALERVNRPRSDEARLRLRAAFHFGVVYESANGYSGTTVNTVCRLRDSDELRRALAAAPASNLALAVSERVYTDVVRHRLRDLDPALFHRVVVDRPGQQFRAEAWIFVPSSGGGGLGPLGVPASGPPVMPGGLIEP